MSYGKPCIRNTGVPSAGPASAQATSSTPASTCFSGPIAPVAAMSIGHHAADRLAALHQVEALVDVFQRHRVGDEVVDVDLVLHVPVDDLRHVGAAARAAEGRALPHAPGHQLEGPRRDLLARL